MGPELRAVDLEIGEAEDVPWFSQELELVSR